MTTANDNGPEKDAASLIDALTRAQRHAGRYQNEAAPEADAKPAADKPAADKPAGKNTRPEQHTDGKNSELQRIGTGIILMIAASTLLLFYAITGNMQEHIDKLLAQRPKAATADTLAWNELDLYNGRTAIRTYLDTLRSLDVDMNDVNRTLEEAVGTADHSTMTPDQIIKAYMILDTMAKDRIAESMANILPPSETP